MGARTIVAGIMLLVVAFSFLFVAATALRLQPTMPSGAVGRSPNKLLVIAAGFTGFICLIIGDWQIRHNVDEPGMTALSYVYAWGTLACFMASAAIYAGAKTVFGRLCFIAATGVFMLATCVNLAF